MKDAKQLNQTPLSKAVSRLLKETPDLPEAEPCDLILEEALLRVMQDELRENPEKYRKYVLNSAVELLEGMAWNRYSPETRYKYLTTNPEAEGTPEEQEAYLLELTQEKTEYWNLGTVTDEMLDCLKQGFNLEPEFPELL